MFCPEDGAPLALSDQLDETDGGMVNAKGTCEHGCQWFVLTDVTGEYKSLAFPYIPIPKKAPGEVATEDTPEVAAMRKTLAAEEVSQAGLNASFGAPEVTAK